MKTLAMIVLLAWCGCGGSQENNSMGGTSGERSCADIEGEYLATATASSATNCTTASDCSTQFGLCKASGDRVLGNARGVYNTTTVQKLNELDAEWKNMRCGGSSCQGSVGGNLGCVSGSCEAQ